MDKKLHIGEIAEILDLYGNGDDGASMGELSRLFHISPPRIRRIIKKYKNQFEQTGFSEYLEN